jgi:ubiquinone biosynthesis protein
VEVRVRVVEDAWLLEGMQKMSNRIAMGIVVAALILGAAMMMRIPTRFTFLGYPGIAMFFFLLAAALGLVLVLDILLRDIRHRDDK